MSLTINYQVHTEDTPIWAFALHDGHLLDEELTAMMFLSEEERLREEDPYTAQFAELPSNQFIVGTSRFQLDLNRTKKESVYLRPEQAWGLNVWSEELSSYQLESLYHHHHNIYHTIDQHIQNTIAKHGQFILLDIHSYNAQRESIYQAIDYDANPQINIGTQFNHTKWTPLTQAFIEQIASQTLYGEKIDIRENIKFKGGYLSQHINEHYGNNGLVLSIEFRKDFMNEWTGEPYVHKIAACKQLMINSTNFLENYLRK